METVLLALNDKLPAYFTFPQELLTKLSEDFPKKRFRLIHPDELADSIEDAEALLTWQFPREAFEKARNLRFVMYAADGLGEKRLYPELVASPLPVINSRGVRAPAMAEHAMGMLLGLSRRLFEARDFQQKKHWSKRKLIETPLPGELQEKTAVILGLGEVGGRIAYHAKQGFRMRVLGVRASPDKGDLGLIDRVFSSEERQKALLQADVVFLALPPTEATTHILGKQEISILPKRAIIINVGRGNALDEEALLHGLQSGHLGGAALDVFSEEPLEKSSEFWNLPNVFLSPHSSGVTPMLWPRIVDIFSDNLIRCALGKPLQNLVNKQRGY